MKKEIPLAIIGAISICVLIWSSLNINTNTIDLLRTHLLSPAKLYRRPRLLCWVLTVDLASNHPKKKAVETTWGKRCDKLLIVTNGTATINNKDATNSSSSPFEAFDGILLVHLDRDGRDQLWHKVIAAFTYIHEHYLDHYDWFMKADDDTYVMVDNLKEFLRQEEPDDPIYFGRRFRPYIKQGYMSGGAGYILSRRALELLVSQGFGKKLGSCHLIEGSVEDVEMGSCLQAVGVRAGDTRDSEGKPTFLPLSPVDLLSSEMDDSFWYNSYDYYGIPEPGRECCSSKPISFHYIEPSMMYFIDYLVYDLNK